jgi:outer membrane protein insertion porin family
MKTEMKNVLIRRAGHTISLGLYRHPTPSPRKPLSPKRVYFHSNLFQPIQPGHPIVRCWRCSVEKIAIARKAPQKSYAVCLPLRRGVGERIPRIQLRALNLNQSGPATSVSLSSPKGGEGRGEEVSGLRGKSYWMLGSSMSNVRCSMFRLPKFGPCSSLRLNPTKSDQFRPKKNKFEIVVYKFPLREFLHCAIRAYSRVSGESGRDRPAVWADSEIKTNMQGLSTMECAAAPRSALRWRWLLLTLLICGFSGLPARADDTDTPPAAKFKISGYGFFGDLRLKRIIKLLEVPKSKPEFFDANFMEDSALILTSKLRDDGYLRPKIVITVFRDDGKHVRYFWNETEPLPRPLRATEVRFKIRKGVLFHFDKLEFNGLTALTEKKARSYFIETSGLVPLKQNRIYAPEHLKNSVANLEQVLSRMGYQDAKVTIGKIEQDDRTGNVSVRIDVQQGPKFIVRSVRREVYFLGTNAPVDLATNRPQQIYSKWWEQDFTHGVRTNYYRLGYPETSVTMETERREPTGTNVFLDLLAVVKTGARVRAGDVSFKGNKRTSESMLSGRVPLHTADWLDPLKAERGQYRLARLGIFESVELKYETVSSNLWDVRYDLKEGKRIEISPLAGFGSYDLLRVGVEIDQYNLWGLAHNSEFKLVQSFKSSSVDYTYTVPELLGEDVDVFATASGLRREEISFTRVEYGGGVGARKYFHQTATDVSVRYNYGILQATEQSANFAQEGAQNPTVGEVLLDVRHDRRDNPLYPRRGYQVMANIEVATDNLGGDANFQRVELGGSYHFPFNDSQWIHLGVRHGFVATSGSTSNNLPFTRRFFPGGQDSVRGYQDGEAAPRNAQHKIVGAETYTSGNFEFEQGITPKWSVVGFFDAVEFAERLDDYPGNEHLFSVGGGVRWRTIIGPVRLEYGYNLNPRPRDPTGTLQFSLGFPF